MFFPCLITELCIKSRLPIDAKEVRKYPTGALSSEFKENPKSVKELATSPMQEHFMHQQQAMYKFQKAPMFPETNMEEEEEEVRKEMKEIERDEEEDDTESDEESDKSREWDVIMEEAVRQKYTTTTNHLHQSLHHHQHIHHSI